MKALALGLSAILFVSCTTVTVPAPEEVQVKIPDRPKVTHEPRVRPCTTPLGALGMCVEMTLEDWQKIRLYYHELEREARYLCLAHGKSKSECKAD